MQGKLQKVDALPSIRPGFRHYWWLAAILLCFAMVSLPLDFVLSNPNNLEYLPGDLTRTVGLSEIFAHGYGVFLIALVIYVMADAQRRLIPRIVACAFWPGAGVHLLKVAFGRYRPIYYFDENSQANFPGSISDTWLGWLPNDKLNIAYGIQSFPSAHTATVWGLAIGLAWAFPKGRWIYFGVAILASIQRVTSFAHWNSDVLFGAAIAFVMAGALTQNWGFGYWFGRFENPIQAKLLKLEDHPNRRAA